MNRYMEFNIVRFLADSRHWKDQKKKLLNELDCITEIKGQSDSVPSKNKTISDTTADTAVERIRLENQIQRIEYFEDVLERSRSMLSDEQNEVLNAFFFDGGYISYNVDILAEKRNTTPRTIYRIRRETLEILRKIITISCFE